MHPANAARKGQRRAAVKADAAFARGVADRAAREGEVDQREREVRTRSDRSGDRRRERSGVFRHESRKTTRSETEG